MNSEFESNLLVESGAPFSAVKELRSDGGSGEDSEGLVREGVVKWFRIDKGYGFVALSGTEDAFLHLKALRAFGREDTTPGAKIKVVVEHGARGIQVTRVLAIEDAPQLSFAPRGGRRAPRDLSSAVDLTGTVKWFDDVRGFGFVASDDFGRDVFVHCTVLGAAGLGSLDQGQSVSMRVIETPKGREAVQVSL